MPEERVQKILARAGYGSRRDSEELITAGRVRINGEVAVLGSKADPTRDTITIDQQPIARAPELTYIAVNKPAGVLSEVSPDEPRETVRDLVPVPGHLFIVGRLDLDSEGLILLTNDGELANRLTHPRYGHEKEYRVHVGDRPDAKQLDAWRHGVVLEDGYRTAPAQVRLDSLAGKGAWLQVILREGRKRQIREMGRLTGLPVLRIQRIRIGSLWLGDLKPGDWRALRSEEIRALKANKPHRETVRDASRPSRRSPGARTTRRTPGQGAPAGSGTPSTARRPGTGPSRPARRSPENRPGRRPSSGERAGGGQDRRPNRPPRGGRSGSTPR